MLLRSFEIQNFLRFKIISSKEVYDRLVYTIILYIACHKMLLNFEFIMLYLYLHRFSLDLCPYLI